MTPEVVLNLNMFCDRLNKARRGLGTNLKKRFWFCRTNEIEFTLGENLSYNFLQTYKLETIHHETEERTVGYYSDLIGYKDAGGEFWCKIGTLKEVKIRTYTYNKELFNE